MPRVGIPRAMSYYYLYPFMHAFLTALGAEVVLSPPTTKGTLQKMDFCPTDEPCVAVKLLFAHVRELLDARVPYVFVPSLVSLERGNFCCPKFIGAPYMIRNALANGTTCLAPVIDLYHGRHDWQESFVEVAYRLGVTSRARVLQALKRAWAAQEAYVDLATAHRLTAPEAFACLTTGRTPARRDPTEGPAIGVIGHPYVLYDAVSLDLIRILKGYGPVITAEMIPPEAARAELQGILESERLWNFEAQILGAALYVLRRGLVERLVLVGSFECGPESVIENYVEQEAARLGIPFLLLTVDEHTAEAGLVTRVEAFMDVAPAERPAPQAAYPVPGPRRAFTRVGTPSMGYLEVALRAALADCGVESVKTPPAGQEIIRLGKEVAPEFICLPFIVTLGQMRWLLEHGVDCLLMVGGKGRCRLGWYAQMQEAILRRLGYDFQMVIIDSPLPLKQKWGAFRDALKFVTRDKSLYRIVRAIYFGYHKMSAIDEAERLCHWLRAFERERGTADRLFRRFLARVDRASEVETVRRLRDDFRRAVLAVEREDTDPVRVRIAGEIWVVLESSINFELERMLGRHPDPRVWVDREICATRWFDQHILHLKSAMERKREIARAAAPYLGTEVGGHGLTTVGLAACAPREGIDGLIHLMPFTCMPEIVAQNILVRVSRDLDLPVLTLILTDQTGEAGLETRVEAFLDLLKERRRERGRPDPRRVRLTI